jgi:hypothetical protein
MTVDKGEFAGLRKRLAFQRKSIEATVGWLIRRANGSLASMYHF